MDTDLFRQILNTLMSNKKKTDKLFASMFCDLDLNSSEAQCFMIIMKHKDGVSAKRIGEYMCYDKALISRSAASLMQKGYIRRNPLDDELSRNYRLQATDSGRALYSEIEARMETFANRFFEGVTEEEFQDFMRRLNDMSERLDRLVKEERQS